MPDHSKVIMQINDHILELEVVNTAKSHEEGLSNRKTIGADGMLFIFPISNIPAFWMKDMLFDLDMVWIKNHKVIEITENIPHPVSNTINFSLPVYKPNQPIDWVLELPAGSAKRLNIKRGDELKYRGRMVPADKAAGRRFNKSQF